MKRFYFACLVGLLLFCGMAACLQEEGDISPVASSTVTELSPLLQPGLQVEVPQELSFAQLKGEDDVGTEACRVTLLYCKDPRYTPRRPSFCSNGCSGSQAPNKAYNLCLSNCANSCSALLDVGGC